MKSGGQEVVAGLGEDSVAEVEHDELPPAGAPGEHIEEVVTGREYEDRREVEAGVVLRDRRIGAKAQMDWRVAAVNVTMKFTFARIINVVGSVVLSQHVQLVGATSQREGACSGADRAEVQLLAPLVEH